MRFSVVIAAAVIGWVALSVSLGTPFWEALSFYLLGAFVGRFIVNPNPEA